MKLLSRRKFCLLALSLGVSGCSQNQSITSAFESFKLLTSGFPDVPLTRAQIDSIPYATIAAKIGKGPRSLLVLGRTNNQDLHWISNDKKILVSRHGRIIKTAGFSRDMRNTRFMGQDPVQNSLLSSVEKHTQLNRMIDMMPGNFFGVNVKSFFSVVKDEKIEIVEKTYQTKLIKEHCLAQDLEWEFDNYYWVDGSGFIWKSIQHFVPDMPPVKIEVLTPYQNRAEG